MTDVEGVLLDHLVFDAQIDVIQQSEIGADLVALRGRLGNAAYLTEVVRVFTIAADVKGAVGADVADPLTEIGQAGGVALVDVGLGGVEAVAVGAGERRTVGQRHIGIVQRAGTLRIGQCGLTPARTRQGRQIAEQPVVDHAIIDRRGRIGVDSDEGMRVFEPVDVEALDLIDVFVLGEGVQVQTVVKQVDAGQGRDAFVGLAVLVDHAVVGVDLEAFEITAQLEVQHARHGVGAVDRRGAAGDDLDVLDQKARDGVDVHRQVALLGADMPAAVNEHQGATRAQRAQVGEGQTAVVQVRTGGVRRNQ